MILTDGKAYDYKGGIAIYTSRPPVENLSYEVEVIWHDNRKISGEQRRKAYALLGEISDWSGEELERVKLTTKHRFLKTVLDGLQDELFSLSDCDMTQARQYIGYLIDFILEFDVPVHVPLTELTDDVQKMVYACLIHKKCAVCGQTAELHHVDRIGMGNDRTKVEHIGRKCLPLCRMHHIEVDNLGDEEFMNKYHLEPVEIDDKIVKIYGLRSKKK